jgi:hypothetical protein
MYAVGFVLSPARNDARNEVDTATLTDIFWSLTVPGDGLEHVHVSTVAGHLDITLFVQADGLLSAVRAARILCQRVVDLTPTLDGWAILPP